MENIKEGYKDTTMGVIPEDWLVKRIEELVTIQNGRGYSHLEKGDIPVYASGGIINYVDKYLYEGISIGIGRKGTIDKPQLLTGKYWVIDTLFFMNNFKDVYPYFLYSKFHTINWYRYNESSGLPSLIKNTIKKIQLPIPPLPEQKTIANCLTTWDSGIEKLSALIKAKKEQKKGLMQQLLTGEKRLDGFEGEWEEIKLGEFFKERNERGLNDLELLSVGEQGVYPQSESNKRDTSNEDKTKYKLIEQGDLGYNTMRLWQGRIALSALRGIVSPAYTIITPKSEKVNSKFFSYFFKMPFVVHLFYKSSQGMVSDTLTCRYNDFKKIKVNVPSKEEQTAIAEVLTTADKEITLLEKKLEGFKEQKRGLMQVLLTGERRLIENC